MATITTSVYLEDAARSAGEAMTINSGGKLTIRSDTRWHANAPGSYAGSLGAFTINEGEILFDATKTRWLPFKSGTGNVPAIGTSITGTGATASYLLGVYEDAAGSAPLAVASAMPPTGFIKFREVSGAFQIGDLSGIGATATGVDVVGWIEVVCDAAVNHTVSRLGKHTIRGDWFYLANTLGAVAQVLQVPLNGGGSTTYCPGVWIENTAPRVATYTWVGNVVTVSLANHGYVVDEHVEIVFTSGAGTPLGEYQVVSAPASGTFTFALTGSGTGGTCTVTTFDFWPALNGTTNGWNRASLGGPYGATDKRQSFVKMLTSGQMQIGEASDLAAGSYATIAPTASTTYASIAHSCTYTWAGDIVTVTYATGHLLNTGMTVHLDFTSGGATAYDGNYVITVIDAYTYTAALAGSGAAGNVTARPGHTITRTAHTLGVGDTIYFDFTSGSGVDGEYTIYGVTSANAYLIGCPHATTTSGAVNVYCQCRISWAGHGLAVGNRVYLDITGAMPSGIYTIVTVATDTFDVVYSHTAADSGGVVIKQTIGHVPASGLRTRVPNVFLRECATGSRNTNQVNATIASRPEWATTTAGAIDFEYACSTWYHNFVQPYTSKHVHSCAMDGIIIQECPSALDIRDFGVGMHSALDVRAIQFTSNFAGGTVNKAKGHRGNTPGSADHAIEFLYCKGQKLTKVEAGIVQFVRSTGKAIQLNYCNDMIINNCRIFQSDLPLVACADIAINNLDYCDRFIGYTNLTVPYYAINVATKSKDIDVNGITFGYNGVIPNVHPFAGLLSSAACNDIKLRNAGSFASPLSGGTWRKSLYGMAALFVSGGNNDTIKIQRCYVSDGHRTGLVTTINSDKNMAYESLHGDRYVESAKAIYLQIDAGLNSIIKGCRTGANTVAGQSSTYGTHFQDIFLGDTVGRFYLCMNEPTVETDSQFTMVAGTEKFNSAGGILMGVINDQAIWEDSCFRLGHTGFQNVTPVMSGGTITNYTLQYKIDLGAGYGASWATLTGANLSAITVDPAIGFKMKIQITTTNTNTTAITYLRIDTTSSSAAQSGNLYPLDLVPITVQVLDIETGLAIASARVLLTAADGSGGLPYQASVSITRTGTTAVVTHSAHGLASGSKEVISGANQPEYNGVKTITRIDAGSYSFTVSGSPATVATGTIISTGVVLDGATDVTGVVTGYMSVVQNINITGRARRASDGALYKSTPITGIVTTASGFSTIVQMIPDV